MAATLSARALRHRRSGLAALIVLIALAASGGSPAGAADPTQPPERLLQSLSPATAGAPPAGPALAPIVLQAIVQSDSRPARVMVDGWLYRVGDTVHGRRLVAIGQHSADFDTQGRRQTVALVAPEGIVRRRRGDTPPELAQAAPIPSARNMPVRTPARRTNKENP